MAVHRGH